jgi:hypothetical protein
MPGYEDRQRDLAELVVPRHGGLCETQRPAEPYALVDPDGEQIEPVAVFLQDLQAAGRPPATQRSYAVDLLRWFRFLWSIEVAWDRATRVEARDFSRWFQLADKPTRDRSRPTSAAGAVNADTDFHPGTGHPNRDTDDYSPGWQAAR